MTSYELREKATHANHKNNQPALAAKKKSKLKRLLYQGWIRRHEMKCGKQAIPCYTVGLSGCRMPGIEDHCWIGWDVPDVTLCIYTFVSIHCNCSLKYIRVQVFINGYSQLPDESIPVFGKMLIQPGHPLTVHRMVTH